MTSSLPESTAARGAATPVQSGMVLVRHGQTDWNKAGKLQGQVDIPLNATGREQAAAAAEGLRGGGWTRVVTSPLGRALETGSIIARALGLPEPTTHEGLLERAYGDLEGVRDVDLPQDVSRVLHPGHDVDPGPVEEEGYRNGWLPGVERSHATAERGVQTLRALAREYPQDRTIVVSHGTIIRLALDAIDDWKHFHDGPGNAEASELSAEQWAALTRA